MFGDILGAAEAHLGGLDSREIVNHLLGMVPNMPDEARAGLAQTVLGALGQNGTDESTVQDAGVATDDAKNGDPDALSALLQHAASDPASLKEAAIAYATSHPELLKQYAPNLMQGILGRLGV
jgi:hypothetical protein